MQGAWRSAMSNSVDMQLPRSLSRDARRFARAFRVCVSQFSRKVTRTRAVPRDARGMPRYAALADDTAIEAAKRDKRTRKLADSDSTDR